MESSSRRSRTQLWLGLLLSLASLIALFWLIDPSQIWRTLLQARLGYVLLSLAGMLTYLWLRAVRWRYMLHQGASLQQVFHTQNIGYMLTQILPFRLGDLARAVLIGNLPGLRVAQGLSPMVVERVLDMLLIVVVLPFTLAGLTHLPDWMREYALISGVAGVGAMAALVLAANFRPKTRQILTRLLTPLAAPHRDRWVERFDQLLAALTVLTDWRTALILAALSLLTWLPTFFSYQAMLRAVGLPANFVMAVFATCAGALSIAAPSSPSGAGVFHAGITVALVEVLGLAQAPSAAFAFLYHGVDVLLLLILGQWGLIRTDVTFSQVVSRTRNFLKTQDAAAEPGESLEVGAK